MCVQGWPEHNPSSLVVSDMQLRRHSVSKETPKVIDGTYKSPKILYTPSPSGCEPYSRLSASVTPRATMSVRQTLAQQYGVKLTTQPRSRIQPEWKGPCYHCAPERRTIGRIVR